MRAIRSAQCDALVSAHFAQRTDELSLIENSDDYKSAFRLLENILERLQESDSASDPDRKTADESISNRMKSRIDHLQNWFLLFFVSYFLYVLLSYFLFSLFITFLLTLFLVAHLDYSLESSGTELKGTLLQLRDDLIQSNELNSQWEKKASSLNSSIENLETCISQTADISSDQFEVLNSTCFVFLWLYPIFRNCNIYVFSS